MCKTGAWYDTLARNQSPPETLAVDFQVLSAVAKMLHKNSTDATAKCQLRATLNQDDVASYPLPVVPITTVARARLRTFDFEKQAVVSVRAECSLRGQFVQPC